MGHYQSQYFMQFTFLTAYFSVKFRDRQLLQILIELFSVFKVWTCLFVPFHFSPSFGYTSRFRCGSRTASYHMVYRLWLSSTLYPSYRLKASSRYMQLYCQRIQALLIFIHLALEVLSVFQSLCRNPEMTISIKFIISCLILKMLRHLPKDRIRSQ